MELKFQAESRPKHREKSSVLRRRLKADSDVDEVTLICPPITYLC